MNIYGEHTSYDALGTMTTDGVITGGTLTSAYTGLTKTLFCKYLPNVHLDFKFTPDGNNDYVMILLEASNDGGLNFFPISNVVYATTETDVYADGGIGSTTSGIPLVIPGDKTSTAGQAINGYVDFTTVATHIKISAKGSDASAGTLYVRASFLS